MIKSPPIHLDFWIDALATLDQSGDKEPLTALLRDESFLQHMLPELGEYLADLIERRCVPLPKGRPKTPVYTTSDMAMSHSLALKQVDAYRQEGMSLEDALEKAAKESGVSVTALRLSFDGKHTSFRRSKKTP